MRILFFVELWWEEDESKCCWNRLCGLVAACCLANCGHRVFGVEKDDKKLELLEQGIVSFYDRHFAP